MNRKLKLTGLIILAGLFFGLQWGHSLAATGVIYLSPSSASVEKGKNITISLRINPGTSVDSAQATVNYNQSYLQFVSSGLGAFPSCAVNSGGGGTVQFACAILGGGSTSSDSLIAHITFKALAGSGSSALTVTGANAARSGSWTNPSSSGGSISFTTPPSNPPSSGGSGGTGGSGSTNISPSQPVSNSPSASHSISPASTTKKTAPKPIAITADNGQIQFHSASIKLTLSAPAPAYISYGTDKSKLSLKTPQKTTGKSAAVALSKLIPGTTYYYQAVAANQEGKAASKSAVGTFTTKGFTVSVTVLDSSYQPLAGKSVSLHSAVITATTDKEGVAIFNNVAPGEHHISYADGSRDYSRLVYVADDVSVKDGQETATPQAVSAILSGLDQTAKKSHTEPAILYLIILLLIIMAWLARGFIRRWLKALFAAVAIRQQAKVK